MDKITVTLDPTDMVELCDWVREDTTETVMDGMEEIEREAKSALKLLGPGWAPIMNATLTGPFDELAWVKLRFKELPHQYRNVRKELYLHVKTDKE